MNVLVTGGLGFLGSNLAKALLQDGHKVTIFDAGAKLGGNSYNIRGIKDKVTVVRGDIRDFKAVSKIVKNRDSIFCCAGQVSAIRSLSDPHMDLGVNTYGNLNILEACRWKNPEASIIFASTRCVYGKPVYLPIDEAHPTDPVDAYGISKVSAEKYFKLYSTHHGLKTCILRLSNLFGPRQQLRTANYQIIGWFYRRILLNEPLTIYGKGEQTRDFLFVDDACNAFLKVNDKIDKVAGEVFNVSSGRELSLNELVQGLEKVTPNRARVRYKPFPKARALTEVNSLYLSYRKIKKEIHWKPKYSLKEGLKRMHEYYYTNKAIIHYK